ncbi:unnamed protein product [marine sediment metagenome]|uniref:Methyltransferase domain-containing protein n=1 Tax=marine sediment metagenome TaxID=412755 RepID=X1BDV4_9ZZZZ
MSNLRPALKQLINKHDLMGIEIGVWRGSYALIYLKELDIEKVFLIDPYEDEEKKQMKHAHLQLKSYENKIEWIKVRSADVANKFNDGSLDFVYIDGNHQYEFVLKDIILYYPKVKEGGLLSGHDYGKSRWPGVTKAVDEFCKKNSLKLNYGGGKKFDWWIWK